MRKLYPLSLVCAYRTPETGKFACSKPATHVLYGDQADDFQERLFCEEHGRAAEVNIDEQGSKTITKPACMERTS